MPSSAIAWPRRGLARAVLAVALAAALLALASGAEPPGSGAAAREAKVRAWVEANLRAWHWNLPPGEVERIVREAADRLRLGHSSQQLQDWVSAELHAVFYAFAKRGARHDDAVRYALPYDAKIPRLVSQGVGGKLTHHGANQYSFDFLMPIGAPVLAAREGVVARLEDGFALGDASHANAVYVLHADGTFAIYAHLAPGSPVVEGQRVAVGETIGRSGDTGQDSGPHLHFAVQRVDFDGRPKSLPIEFQLTGKDFVPKEKEFWGAPWRPTLQLRVTVDGKPADPAARIPLRRGAAAQLSVEAVLRSGEVQDVTAHARTRFEALTLWSVSVDGPGRVTAKPTAGFEQARVDGDLVRMGTVGVFLGEPKERRRGFAVVEFEIVP